MSDVMQAIGLMSGTSADGIDIAVLETDGEKVVSFGPARSVPYDDALRSRIKTVLGLCATWAPGDPVPDLVMDVERELTIAHARVVRDVLDSCKNAGQLIKLIGFHGQTVLHRPPVNDDEESGFSWQIGNPTLLAQLVGRDVVNQFRLADIARGGQGAPLAPIYHQALVSELKGFGPVVVVNIGGVSNITFAPNDGPLLAFDTGPGNGLIDDWISDHTGARYDEDGAMAASGRISVPALNELLDNRFFNKPPPKSLDRYDFGLEAVADLSVADGAATLTAFTAEAIRLSLLHLPARPAVWIICGGGRHNATLMRELTNRLPGEVKSAEDVGWRGDMIEAEALAFLAVRSALGLPITFPGTTGVSEPLTGGQLIKLS